MTFLLDQEKKKRYSGIFFLGILARSFLLFSWASTKEGVRAGAAVVALRPQWGIFSKNSANSLDG